MPNHDFEISLENAPRYDMVLPGATGTIPMVGGVAEAQGLVYLFFACPGGEMCADKQTKPHEVFRLPMTPTVSREFARLFEEQATAAESRMPKGWKDA